MTVFDIEQKLSKFLLEIITLVSSANIVGSDELLIVGGRLFIYIIRTKVSKPDPCQTPCTSVPRSEGKF
jgi:hypothetical protein